MNQGRPAWSGARSMQPVPDPAMVAQVRESMLAEQAPATGERLAAAVHSTGKLLGSEGTLRTVDGIRAELQGLGPLQPLAEDPEVTDILVNGPAQVWVDGADGLRLTPRTFRSDAAVRALASRLVAAGGRRLDDSNPCVDVRVDAYRVHAVIPPVSTGKTLLSIRIRRPRVFTLAELESTGCVDGFTAEVLTGIVHRRLNFLVSGATGTGKTTLLATMLGLSDPAERLVLVEDAAELNPAHPHTVGLQTRYGNVEGAGAVELAELVRQALRMRPDRLVVGECRGAEVRELLGAMNTGHSGAGGTVHANSAESVPARLAALGALAGLSPAALALQASSALDVVVHLARRRSQRVVRQIGVVNHDQVRGLTVEPALVRNGQGTARGDAWQQLEQLLAPADEP
jgi:pilus assembly protein CpaF